MTGVGWNFQTMSEEGTISTPHSLLSQSSVSGVSAVSTAKLQLLGNTNIMSSESFAFTLMFQ